MPAVYIYNKTLTQSAMAAAVFLCFIAILVALSGSISTWHWWDAGTDFRRLEFTQAAAKTTTVLFAHQAQTGSECPPELDCLAETAVQTFNGTLYAAYDHAVAIGYSAMRCVAIGALGTPALGLWQECDTVYTFTGEANITAGTILTRGKILTPDEEASALQAIHTVVGGTGAYQAASGGVVSFMPTMSDLAVGWDLSFTDVLVSQ